MSIELTFKKVLPTDDMPDGIYIDRLYFNIGEYEIVLNYNETMHINEYKDKIIVGMDGLSCDDKDGYFPCDIWEEKIEQEIIKRGIVEYVDCDIEYSRPQLFVLDSLRFLQKNSEAIKLDNGRFENYNINTINAFKQLYNIPDVADLIDGREYDVAKLDDEMWRNVDVETHLVVRNEDSCSIIIQREMIV